MRCRIVPGSSGLLVVLLIVLGAGAAGARAKTTSREVYEPPRHDSPQLRAFSAATLGASTDPVCDSSIVGVVVLDRDVACEPQNGGGVFIHPGATFDLGGFTFEGIIYASEADNSTLRNGTVLGGALYFSQCQDCVIEDIDMQGASDKFAVQPGLRTVIRDSHFSGDAMIDIYYGPPEGVTVIGCEFENNGTAVNMARGSGHLVTSNVFHDNSVGVVLWNEDGPGGDSDVNDNVVSDNLFEANGAGVVFMKGLCEDAGCMERNRITGNTFTDNQRVGIDVPDFCSSHTGDCDLADLRIEDNQLETSGFGAGVVGGDGLHVAGPPEIVDGIVVARNFANANADLGIEAPGVIDGGGNRARENGNPLQCVGVVCELGIDIDVDGAGPSDFLNLRGNHPIEVAILGSRDFDVSDVDVRSLAFGPAGAHADKLEKKLKPRDENRDGFADLTVRFRTPETGIAFGDREVCLLGETRDGVPFSGCDSILTLRCGRGFELALLLPPALWIRRARPFRQRAKRGAVHTPRGD